MSKINHLNYYAGNLEIYCERLQLTVQADENFARDHCAKCEMFNGHLQGDGIECLYEDSLLDGIEMPFVPIRNPREFEALRLREIRKKQPIKYIVKTKK